MAFDLASSARSLAPPMGPTLVRALWPMAACVVLAVLAQLVLRPNIDPYWVNLTLVMGVNVILAVSLTIVNGLTGQFSMGHAGFLAVGGYVSALVTFYGSMRLNGSPAVVPSVLNYTRLGAMPDGLPLLSSGDGLFVLALLAGGCAAAIMGVLVGLPSLRLRGDYLAIVTLGFGEIVRVLCTLTGPLVTTASEANQMPWWQLVTRAGGSLGFSGAVSMPKYTSVFWIVLFAALTLVLAVRLKRGTFGRALLSIREDEIAAEAMGVNTTRYKVYAFVIAAFFAGVAGGLFAHTLGVGLSPSVAGFQRSFDVIIMVVLGGLGSISGAAIAAAVVTLLPEVLRGLEDYRMVVFALALVLLMIFRPQGLLGVREIWERALWRDAWQWCRRVLLRRHDDTTPTKGGPA